MILLCRATNDRATNEAWIACWHEICYLIGKEWHFW